VDPDRAADDDNGPPQSAAGGTFLFATQEIVDRYGTSTAVWLRTVGVSIGLFALVFLGYHFGMRCRGGSWAFRPWAEWSGTEIVPRGDTSFVRVAGYAVLLSLTSLIRFADRMLDTESILNRLGGPKAELRGFPRVASGVAGLWGLYLAIRGLALLAQL
jgi:hypothetical protein